MRVVLLGNGTWQYSEFLKKKLKWNDLIVACDGAYNKALKVGIFPQVVVGDFDSLRKRSVRPGVELFQFPREKDETDAELAFDFALKKSPKAILWFAPLGTRIDHSLANLYLLQNLGNRAIPVELLQGRWSIQWVTKRAQVIGRIGDRVSLIPFTSQVNGVTTRGLKYALKKEVLFQRKTRGVSNIMTSTRAHVEISRGQILLLHEMSVGGVAFE